MKFLSMTIMLSFFSFPTAWSQVPYRLSKVNEDIQVPGVVVVQDGDDMVKTPAVDQNGGKVQVTSVSQSQEEEKKSKYTNAQNWDFFQKAKKSKLLPEAELKQVEKMMKNGDWTGADSLREMAESVKEARADGILGEPPKFSEEENRKYFEKALQDGLITNDDYEGAMWAGALDLREEIKRKRALQIKCILTSLTTVSCEGKVYSLVSTGQLGQSGADLVNALKNNPISEGIEVKVPFDQEDDDKAPVQTTTQDK